MKTAILIWLAAIAIIAWSEHEPAKAALPIVKAAWSQPQQRRFLICPLDARQVPTTNERTA
jgi:hypothetical protein